MDLREGEQILKIYHHHPTPFVFDILKVIAATFPFFLVLFMFQEILSTKWNILSHIILFFVFALIITYIALIYWLDKLIITNQRIIHIDWKYLTIRDESEAFINDIQDVQTHEKGIFSYFWVFDYGLFKVETAASQITLEFLDAPNPEGIRQFIYHIRKQ